MKLSDLNIPSLLELYDQNRFLDAYEQTRPLWRSLQAVEEMNAEHLVHAGRLACRLGGIRLSRWLFRKAFEQFPAHHLTRLYCGDYRNKKSLYEHLMDFENEPRLNTDDPTWNAVWYATNAMMWARVRQFDRAYKLIDKALGYRKEQDWTYCCLAQVCLFEDKWDEGLKACRAGWDFSPMSPALTQLLGNILIRLGRIDEAIETIVQPAETGQSFENVLYAIWLLATETERRFSDRFKYGQVIDRLCSCVESKAPLADKELRSHIALCHAWSGFYLGDYDKILRSIEHIHSPFFSDIKKSVLQNPDGRLYLSKYKPVIQKHNTCLPASVAAVVGRFGIDLDEDQLAKALTYNGTATWRAARWLTEQGYLVKSFIVTPKLCRTLLEAGLPFIFTRNSPGSSHAMAAVGYDQRLNTLILHDPSCERWGMVLMDKMHYYEEPYGPDCLAIAPEREKALLDLIPDSQSLPSVYTMRFYQTWEEQGQKACVAIVDRMKKELGEHPCTRRLESILAAFDGNIGFAIGQQEQLLKENPENIVARHDLIDSLRRTNDTFRICQVMGDIVEKGRIPAVNENQKWTFPPANYVTQYADYISYTARGLEKSIHLLTKSLRYEPLYAATYHVLGDLYRRKGQHEHSITPFLIAAGLDDTNDHFARSFADACRYIHQESKGLDYLRSRIKRLGSLVHGGCAWIAWIEALEDYGYPEQAVAAMQQALQSRPCDDTLNAFAAQFWTRMGSHDHAAQALKAIENSHNQKMFLEASVSVTEQLGKWQDALGYCQKLLQLDKNDIAICRLYLNLYAQKHGRRARIRVAKKWCEEFPGHEGFEEILYDYLRENDQLQEAEALIQARIRRNPYDSWALRSQGYAMLNKADCSAGDKRSACIQQAIDICTQLLTLTPHDAATCVYHSCVEDIQGNYSAAVDFLLKAMNISPNDSYCYRRVWDYFENMSPQQQKELPARLESFLFRSHGYKSNAAILISKIAEHFGIQEAERTIDQWLIKFENDPALIETKVDLLLYYGQGRTDARRAEELLKPAMLKFPNRFSLHMSLAHAYDVLGLEDRQVPLLHHIIRRDPKNLVARKSLAEVLVRQGQISQAVEILLQCAEYNPQEDYVWIYSAELLWNVKRFDQSLQILQRGLDVIPESVVIREHVIDYALELRRDEIAVRTAREGTEIYPKGGYMWYLLGYTLERCHISNDLVEVEKYYRKALECNAALEAAIRRLSVILTTQHQYDQARQIIRTALPSFHNPAPLMCQLAWITRQQGQKGKAIDELADVITAYPRYKRAWNQIMEWIEADKDSGRARSVLRQIHPVIREDPHLDAYRLDILEQAGDSIPQIDVQWDRLLNDFPDNEIIHNRRFDILFSKNELSRAGAVIESIEKFTPNSPYILARKVRLLSRQKDWTKAIETALRLWQLPGEEQFWPEDTAWKALSPVWEQALTVLLNALEQGTYIRNSVFEVIARDIKKVRVNGTWLQRLHPSSLFRPYPRICMLLKLLNSLNSQTHDTAIGKAAILDALKESAAPEQVIRYWKRNREKCRQETPVWQRIAYVLVNNYPFRQRQLRRWMQDWRDHAGINMYAITYYSISLRKSVGLLGLRENLQELYAVSRDVLLHLPHDHTAKFHAVVLCESCLRLGKWDEFLHHVDQYQYLLKDEGTDNWLPGQYAFLPKSYFIFAEMLRGTMEKSEIIKLTRQLAGLGSMARPAWLKKAWAGSVKKNLSFWERLYCRLILLGL